MRDPSRKRRWVTTASIIYNQAQSIGLLRSLDLRWPLSIRRLSAALSLELFSVPDVGCLLDEGVPPFWQYAFSVLSTCAALLALPGGELYMDMHGKFDKEVGIDDYTSAFGTGYGSLSGGSGDYEGAQGAVSLTVYWDDGVESVNGDDASFTIQYVWAFSIMYEFAR